MQVHFEIMNMLPPPEFEACTAPEPADESICVITGRAAKYRDPDTNLPYADVGAYQELQLQLRQGAARSLKKQHANNASRKPKQESSGKASLHKSWGLQTCCLHPLQLFTSRFGTDGNHDGAAASMHLHCVHMHCSASWDKIHIIQECQCLRGPFNTSLKSRSD